MCAAIGFLLLPIARRVPRDLILQPVRHLLTLVRSERGESPQLEEPKYEEIRALEGEFKSLMERKGRLEDERVEMQQMLALTSTAQMLAHDIRRPFSLLKAVLDGLSQTTTPEDVRELTEATLPRVKKSFASLDAMLDELVMLGKPRSVSLDNVDLKSVVQRGVDAAISSHPEASPRIRVDLRDGLFVRGSSDHLQRVVTNLVVNGIQAMGTKGTMHIDALQNDSLIEVRVRNTDSYIPPEDHSKIFQPFYTKGKDSGTGLGLAICKRIVSDHGGNLRVKSSIESGTEFLVSLAVADRPDSDRLHMPSRQLQPQAQQPSGHKFRILVADDEIFYRDAVIALTKLVVGDKNTLDLREVESGEQAVKVALETNPDAVIIDIDFGSKGINGIEAVREMRRQGVRATICVHTNNFLESTRTLAMEAGANIFVPKPMAAESLRAILFTANA